MALYSEYRYVSNKALCSQILSLTATLTYTHINTLAHSRTLRYILRGYSNLSGYLLPQASCLASPQVFCPSLLSAHRTIIPYSSHYLRIASALTYIFFSVPLKDFRCQHSISISLPLIFYIYSFAL